MNKNKKINLEENSEPEDKKLSWEFIVMLGSIGGGTVLYLLKLLELI